MPPNTDFYAPITDENGRNYSHLDIQPPWPQAHLEQSVALYFGSMRGGYLRNEDTLKMIHFVLNVDGTLEKLSDAGGTFEIAVALRKLKALLDTKYEGEG